MPPPRPFHDKVPGFNKYTHRYLSICMYVHIYVAAVAKLTIDHDRERIVGRTPSARGEVKRGDPAHKLLRYSAASSIWYLDFPSHTHTHIHTTNAILYIPQILCPRHLCKEGRVGKLTKSRRRHCRRKQEHFNVRSIIL